MEVYGGLILCAEEVCGGLILCGGGIWRNVGEQGGEFYAADSSASSNRTAHCKHLILNLDWTACESYSVLCFALRKLQNMKSKIKLTFQINLCGLSLWPLL